MSHHERSYPQTLGVFAAEADAEERAGFITSTYLHLTGAVGLFMLLEVILLNIPGIERLVATMLSGRQSWLIVLALFMVVSWVANAWASSAISPVTQYAGLLLYVVAQAVIFVPLLYIARAIDPEIITAAALTTCGLFVALTGVVFVTRKDFSFLRAVLIFSGFAAMGLIVAALAFGFSLGPLFTYAMIAFACGYILYDTSNVLYHYRIGQHVAAALALFASVALLFWYVLQLFMSRRR